jgi:glycosyltransferase involved in cell wall biosynthesis
VGEGSLRAELENDFAKNNIDVYFTGYQEYPQMLSILKHSAAVLFPSVWPEPLGRVLIEAGMMAKPAIAFRHPGGHLDVLRDQVNGILADSVETFAKAVRNLFTNVARAEILGLNGRLIYQENFSAEAVMPRLLPYYLE